MVSFELRFSTEKGIVNNPPQNDVKKFQEAEDPRIKADDLEIPQNGIFLLLQALSSSI